MNPQRESTCASLRGDSPYPSQLAPEGQGSLTPLLIQRNFTVVYSVPGPVLGAEDKERTHSPNLQGIQNMIEKALVQGKEDTMRSQTWHSRSSHPSRGLEGTTHSNTGQPMVRTKGRLRLCAAAAQEGQHDTY